MLRKKQDYTRNEIMILIPEQPDQATWRETFLEYMKASEDEVNDLIFFFQFGESFLKFRQGKNLTFCNHESNLGQA